MFTQVCPFGNAGWFTFAWPLGESALKPRGASTRGTPVVLDPAPGEAWRRLREPGLNAFEPFFEYAQNLADGTRFDRAEARAFIDRTLLDTYLAKAKD